MLNPIFELKFPFVYKYFSNLLESVENNERNFPQALIFEGNDAKTQYLFALELARILNCKTGEENCDCINCKWIKSHTHPSINRVSQIHFKGEDDETKTIISVKQALLIEKTLSLSSDYHRFFIFFSSSSSDEQEEIVDFSNLGYESNFDFTIEPLNYSTFHPTTLNAMLKSIEEPSTNTTFIFLTKSKEDILPTIVSRCLTFKLSGKKENLSYSSLVNIFSSYLTINYENAFELADSFLNLVKEGTTIEKLLNQFMEYLKDLFKSNIDNQNTYLKIKKDMEIVNYAIKQIKANVNSKIAIEAMFLKIARGY